MTAEWTPPFRQLITLDQPSVRQEFLHRFHSELERIIAALTIAYSEVMGLDHSVRPGPRAGFVVRYLVYAIDAALSSTQLLVRGWIPPSGHMMRHYGEASALALLFSCNRLPDFEKQQAAPEKYPYHDAMAIISRPKIQKLLRIDSDRWSGFKRAIKGYDQFSHPSELALHMILFADEPSPIQFGGQFDPAKISFYSGELMRRCEAASVLPNVIAACAHHLAAT